MKVRTILITSFLLLITFELVNSDNQTKKNLSQNTKNKFIQKYKKENRNLDEYDDLVKEAGTKIIDFCKENQKPSTAFTVVLMIYMVIIIVGAILVLVLLRKDLSE